MSLSTLPKKHRVGALLIHGLTGSPTEMKVVARQLEADGLKVHTPLLPGHGGGHQKLISTTWQEWLAGVKEAHAELSKECEQIFVVGLCASSLLGILLAAENTEVNGLVLLSTHYGEISSTMPKTRHLLKLAYPFPFLRKHFYWTETAPYGIKDERMQKLITAQIEESKLRETADHGTFRTYVESLYQSHQLVKQAKKKARGVRCPVLILHSLEDTWFPPSNALRLSEDLGSDDKTLLLFTGCDHVMTVDLRKHDVANEISAFIANRSVQKIVNIDSTDTKVTAGAITRPMVAVGHAVSIKKLSIDEGTR